METGEFWFYDPLIDTWEELPPHPESSRWAPASFIIDGEVYIINGTSFSEYVTEIYKFNLNSILSVDEFTHLSIDVYPNPSSDIVYISLEKDQLKKLELYSISGKLLLNNYLNTEFYALNIDGYTSGLYYLRVYNQNGDVVNLKIIKN